MCFMRRPIWIFTIITHLYIFGKYVFINFEEKHVLINLASVILFLLIPLLIDFLTRCPKCSRWMSYHPESTFFKHNGFLPFYNKYCNQCGQNLDKCKIESEIKS